MMKKAIDDGEQVRSRCMFASNGMTLLLASSGPRLTRGGQAQKGSAAIEAWHAASATMDHASFGKRLHDKVSRRRAVGPFFGQHRLLQH